MKELLFALLKRQFGLSSDEAVAELLYKKTDDGKLTDELAENALDTLLQRDSDRVSNLRKNDPDAKRRDGETFDNGYKKGKQEALSDLEKTIRERFGIGENDKRGIDLVAEAVAKAAKTEADADKVKLHPAYLELESRLRSETERLAKEKDEEVANVRNEYTRKETVGRVGAKARETFLALNPVLPSDAAKSDRLVAAFLDGFLNAYDYQQDGEKTVLVKDGKRVEDSHGNPVYLETFVRSQAQSMFDFRVQEDKGNAGNAGSATKSITVPKNEAEYAAAIFAAKTPEERKAIADAYQGQN